MINYNIMSDNKETGAPMDISSTDGEKCSMPPIPEEDNLFDENTTSSQEPFGDPATRGQVNLLNVDIDGHNTALNVMVGFLGVAQKRGAFAINESAKIYECINKFSE